METFLVAEIDNVIDTEDDLFWQFYKCATCAPRQHQIIMAFFKQYGQSFVSKWTETVVHCVFDDKDKHTRALAANASPEPGAKYDMQNYNATLVVGILFDGTWPAHHMTV